MGRRKVTLKMAGRRKIFSCPDCRGSLARVYLQNPRRAPTASNYYFCQSCQKFWSMRFERVGGGSS